MIDFNLPKDLIATEPVQPRDRARLLVYDRKSRTITDDYFYNIGLYLPKNSTIVVNNSKVEHCRWLFDGGIELFVLDKLDTHTIRAMVRKGNKFKLGMTTQLTSWLDVEVLAVDGDGIRTLKLSVSHDDERLQNFEHVPLPPYIPQNDKLSDEYQTVYAKPLGSKAAPTAGLHFTKELLVKLQQSHNLIEVTLHVGLGTFAPLTERQLKSGSLHSERYEISEKAAQVLNMARHITAIGTTSVRTLESNKTTQGFCANFSSTDILIQPGYKWRAVDSLVTNFHLPGTSLLLLVESFVGSEPELKRIYNHAIAEKYRFYSFGDAMLIL